MAISYGDIALLMVVSLLGVLIVVVFMVLMVWQVDIEFLLAADEKYLSTYNTNLYSNSTQ